MRKGKNTLIDGNLDRFNEYSNLSFPLYIKIIKENETYFLNLCPLEFENYYDILEKYSLPYINIFNLFEVNYSNLEEFLNDSEINIEKEYDKNHITIKSTDISKISNNAHYQIEMFDLLDLEKESEVEYLEKLDVIEKYWKEVCSKKEKNSEEIIKNLVGSNFYLSSHDDCYVYLETTNVEMVEYFVKKVLSDVIEVEIDNKSDFKNLFEYFLEVKEISIREYTESEYEIDFYLFNGRFLDINPDEYRKKLRYIKSDKKISLEENITNYREA